MTTTVIAAYNTMKEAYAARKDLKAQQIPDGHIGFAANDSDDQFHALTKKGEVRATEGAGFGAGVGAVAGLLTGLATVTLPGIGPLVVAGPLAVLAGGVGSAGVGAAAGAVTGGIVAKFTSMGIPEDDAEFYAELLRRGGAVVSVETQNESAEEKVIDILSQHNPVNMDYRVEQWRQSGWKGFDPETNVMDQAAREMERRSNEMVIMPPTTNMPKSSVRIYPLIPPR